MKTRLSAILIASFLMAVGLLGSFTAMCENSSRHNWNTEIVDAGSSDVGKHTSMVLDSNGHPHISYFDSTAGTLKYAKWTGKVWNIVDVGDAIEGPMSIALDSSGFPNIVYIKDNISSNLTHARWDGSTWSFVNIDNKSMHPSMAIDSNGNLHVSYYDSEDKDLKYAKGTSGLWSTEIVDSAGDIGRNTSIAVDNNGEPHISYYDYTNEDLKYARWADAWNIDIVDDAHEGRSSIALDVNARPHITYYDGDLKYARWNVSSWIIETVDGTGNVGMYSSLALGSTDNPHISYCNVTTIGNNTLKYARWTGSNWSIETVDSEGNTGWFTSIALDGNDNPRISYYDETHRALKYTMGNLPTPVDPKAEQAILFWSSLIIIIILAFIARSYYSRKRKKARIQAELKEEEERRREELEKKQGKK